MSRIALISPSLATSETFIKAHKEMLSGEVHFLYGGLIPTHSEKTGEFKLGITVKLMNVVKGILGKDTNRVNYLSSMVKDYLRKYRIELVMTEYGHTGAEMLPICKELNIPIIPHFHGYDAFMNDVVEKYKGKYRELFEYAKYIVVVSNDMKNQLVKIGASEDKIIVNPCSPQEQFEKLSPKIRESNTFVTVGRFVDKKAPYFTILAFSQLLKIHPDAKLRMAGYGPLFEVCHNLVDYLKIKGSVDFLGETNHTEIPLLMKNSFCFLQHSITSLNNDKEGTPVGILEASLSGLPVVSTKHGGIVDSIVHGKTGYLVEEKDVENMSRYMLELYENRDKAVKMGEEGKIYVKENFSISKGIKVLDNLIENVINESRP